MNVFISSTRWQRITSIDRSILITCRLCVTWGRQGEFLSSSHTQYTHICTLHMYTYTCFASLRFIEFAEMVAKKLTSKSLFTYSYWIIETLVRHCINTITHRGQTKWPPFRRRHFKVQFLEWNPLNIKEDFTEIYSLWSNRQYCSISLDNGLVPNRYRGLW